MERHNWYLQLFAENTSGETAADAGQQPRAEKGQDAAADNKRLTWEQIMADPEYNRQMQAIIRARLAAGSTRRQFVTDPGENLDTAGSHSVTENSQKSTKIDKTGSTRRQRVNASLVKGGAPEGRRDSIPQSPGGDSPLYKGASGEQNRDARGPLEASVGQGKPEQHKGFAWQSEQHLQQHFGALRAQAESLQAAFPEFSLEKALKDPKFLHLTAPHVGLSVENAWYLLNREKIQAAAMQLAAKRTAEKLSNAIATGGHRPVENGTAARAPSVSRFDTITSREQRDALKKAIYRSASRGEKLYPND